MKDLKQLKAQYKKLGEEIERLEGGVWVPDFKDKYFYLSHGFPSLDKTYRGEYLDIVNISIGNYFRTKEEAERHKQKLIVLEKLRRLSGGFKPNWDKCCFKYTLAYNHAEGNWFVSMPNGIEGTGQIYFPTEKSAQNAIDTLGDELNILLE